MSEPEPNPFAEETPEELPRGPWGAGLIVFSAAVALWAAAGVVMHTYFLTVSWKKWAEPAENWINVIDAVSGLGVWMAVLLCLGPFFLRAPAGPRALLLTLFIVPCRALVLLVVAACFLGFVGEDGRARGITALLMFSALADCIAVAAAASYLRRSKRVKEAFNLR